MQWGERHSPANTDSIFEIQREPRKKEKKVDRASRFLLAILNWINLRSENTSRGIYFVVSSYDAGSFSRLFIIFNSPFQSWEIHCFCELQDVFVEFLQVWATIWRWFCIVDYWFALSVNLRIFNYSILFWAIIIHIFRNWLSDIFA